ncbi:MAG: hypothetical protein DHS20C19_12180 [Acidimicrobiales bacterium]|nr:MAG: hypothetical protein DHS20C19_12180 [Acidimicrobiales bacterium]
MLQMNPDDLITLRNTFDTQADAVIALQGAVQSSLDNTVWESPAATEFRSIWDGEFVPMLQRLNQALTDAGLGVQNSHDKVVDANSAI